MDKIQQRDEKFHEKGHAVVLATPRCLFFPCKRLILLTFIRLSAIHYTP